MWQDDFSSSGLSTGDFNRVKEYVDNGQVQAMRSGLNVPSGKHTKSYGTWP